MSNSLPIYNAVHTQMNDKKQKKPLWHLITHSSVCYSGEHNMKSVEIQWNVFMPFQPCESVTRCLTWVCLSAMVGLQSVQRNLRQSMWTFVWVGCICSSSQWVGFLLQHVWEIGNKQAWWTSTTLKYWWFPCKLKLYSWKANNSGEISGSLPTYFSYSDTKQGCQGYLELHL